MIFAPTRSVPRRSSATGSPNGDSRDPPTPRDPTRAGSLDTCRHQIIWVGEPAGVTARARPRSEHKLLEAIPGPVGGCRGGNRADVAAPGPHRRARMAIFFGV